MLIINIMVSIKPVFRNIVFLTWHNIKKITLRNKKSFVTARSQNDL